MSDTNSDEREEYSEADQYVYVLARGFEGADRKRPACAWVNDCPDGIDPRSMESPHTLAYEETTDGEPYIIVGARGGHMLDIDVDVGEDHDETFEGDINDIQTVEGMVSFLSASGGPHQILKFEREHRGLSGVEGVDLQGDMEGNLGVVTSPFHHPEYELLEIPETRICFDDVVESDDVELNNGFGVELVNIERASAEGESLGFNGDNGSTDGDGREYEEYLTDDDIKDALSFVPQNLHYDDWRAIAFAVHDYDSSANGKRLFQQWSRRGSKWDSDSKENLEGFWDHADNGSNSGQEITLGTLIRKAEQEGWDKPSPDPSDRVQSVWAEQAPTLDDPAGPVELGNAAEKCIDALVEGHAAGMDRATVDMWLKQISDESNKAYTKSGLSDMFGRRMDAAVSEESAQGETGNVTPRVSNFIDEHLKKVIVNRVTDHNVDTSYQWHFNGNLDVVFSTTGGTHWDWHQFRERYFDETGVDLREPRDGSADEWRAFVVGLIEKRGEESHVRGPRTETIGALKNYIERRTAFGELDAAALREGVYRENENADELWVLSKDIQRLCAEREVETRGLQEELRARGLTTGNRVAERRRSNGTRVTWWRLDAAIADPRTYESGEDVIAPDERDENDSEGHP